MKLDEVKAVLAGVTFAPSCVDMAWEWEVQNIWRDRLIHGVEEQVPAGYMVRTTFQRPDCDAGAVTSGYGRWWHLPEDVTESGVVKTAYKAALLILEHELMESFKYEGIRVFDPHHTVDDLAMAAFAAAVRNGEIAA